MRLKIQQFLREFSVREIGKLQSPKLFSLKRLQLPFESIYHFQDGNGAVLGPSQMDPLFAKLQGKVYIEHVTELESFEGNPRKTSALGPTLIQDFRRQNRFFKPLRSDEGVRLSPENILVVNYNLVNPMWAYMATYKSTWYRWNNNAATFWQGVENISKRFPSYNQFIEVKLPPTIPAFTSFNMLRGGVTQDLMAKFNTPEQLDIYDIYLWISDYREQSHLSKVDPKYFDNINFLFRVQNSFFVINLGQLNKWRKDPEIKDDKGYDTNSLNRRFISLITAMVEYAQGNSALITEEDPVFNVEPVSDVADVIMGEYEEGDEDSELEDGEDKEPLKETVDVDIAVVDEFDPLKLDSVIDLSELEVTYTPPPESDLVKIKLQIEDDPSKTFVKDIKEAEKSIGDGTLSVNNQPDESVFQNSPVDPDDELVSSINSAAFDLYQVGLISARTYEMAQEDSITYRSLPDPFGSGKTIAEAMEYTKEDLEIPKDTVFEDKTTIIDKSMLGSKLKPMVRKYNRDLLPKDMLNMVMSVQKLDVSVTNYEIEEVQDVLNHYQVHTVTLKPIRGRASTITFRTPVIDDDGRFTYNGTTYRQRLQRGDIPIRKVAYNKVALTSYYNKTFVTRSERAENNMDVWLTRQIRARDINKNDRSVHSLVTAEIDQTNYVLPRVYSALGRSFRSFMNYDTTYYFRYEDREQFFTSHGIDIKEHETEDMMVVGFNANGVILLDMNSIFYFKENNDVEPVGTIFDILGLDLTKAPLETVLVSIGNKELPIGFVLAYQFGLKNLLNSLDVTYQQHKRGTRIITNNNDYTLAFADEILVFNRADTKATLILAGLKRYHQSLKRYSVYDFNKRDVYFRILEEAGLSPRYLRDIDNLFKAWVDPITKGILEEMGEPTTFGGLLNRSIELLMNDWSPSEVDGAYMRYRGYERMAGAVFSELTKCVRNYNNREGAADQAITMNPHDIWRKIVGDPTVATIEDSNPMANLREQEAMTYRGDGGRGSVSMVARTRIYGEADVGVISEATVDSSDVGVIAYLVPDANFVNMRGITRMFDPKVDGPSKIISSCALTGVATTNDD